jgi:hypothetical protein
MTDQAADLEAAIDALDAIHEQTWHAHAAECCMQAAAYATAMLDGVLPAHDRALILALADEIEQAHKTAVSCGYDGAVRVLRAKAEQIGGDDD